MFRRFIIPALALLAALAAVEPASAQRGRDRDRDHNVDFQSPKSAWDQSEERQQPREVQLSSILRDLQQKYGGRHVDANRNGDRWVIAWVTQDGRRLTVEADARTGRIISTRGG